MAEAPLSTSSLCNALKAQLKEVLAQRDAMEADAAAITARLNAPGMPGLKGGLLDKEGYPRADIDIAAVRSDRHRLACLCNDHKSISDAAEQLLSQLHAAARAAGGAGGHSAPPALAPGKVSRAAHAAPAAMAPPPPPSPPPPPPFAVIDEVADASPAAAAGLRVGDRVVCFGGVSAPQAPGSALGSGSVLPRVAQLLASSEGVELCVDVLRNGMPHSVRITPRPWNGRGLLGCHLQPL